MDTQFKQFALTTARKAGEMMKQHFKSLNVSWKEDNTPFTAADTGIHDMVAQELKQHFPLHSLRSEEGSFVAADSEYTWLCDPLDGTIPYAHGVPTAAFTLSLTKFGQSLLGVVYDPFMDRLWYAEKGRGSWLNDEQVQVSSKSSLENSLIGIGFWKGAQFEFLHLLNRLKLLKVKTLDLASTAYMGALVASGEFAAVISPTAAPFDPAAVKVIVEEAGGKVTDIFGHEQRYDRDIRGHLVSNGVLHEELVAIIQATVK
jgi:myo-inositol-1(or 4)-monophosphatase